MHFKTLLLITIPMLISCNASVLVPESTDDPVRTILLNRAGQMVGISWTPLGEVPTQGGVFPAGKKVEGVPYSSVKEHQKYVGQYVSFYTFMTAVANPKSVIYTENVKNPPYHGTNCSTYYGTVCSMSVNYVLGLPYSYTTSMYKSLDCFSIVFPQSIEEAEPGDILLQDNKHVVMIMDIIRTKSDIERVFVLESSGGSGTRIQTYSKEALLSRWKRDGWELLRYRDLDKLPEVESMSFNSYPYDTPFNSPMCCNRGDRATFREGEAIVLNNLDGKPHTMRLLQDNTLADIIVSNGTDVTISNLTSGIYTFDLSNSAWNNPSVEVLETTVSIERKEDMLDIAFSSCNGKPMSVIISNLSGAQYLVQPITDDEREAGKMTVQIPAISGKLYLKMMFEGTYGSVMNEPLAI